MMVRFRDSCTFEPFRDLKVHSFLKNQILVWTPFALGYFNYDTTISGYWHSFEREMLAANISTKSLVATNALLENSNGLSRRWIHYSSQSKGFGLLSKHLSFWTNIAIENDSCCQLHWYGSNSKLVANGVMNK